VSAEDRLKRYQGEAPATLPVVSEDPGRAGRAADVGFLALIHRDRQDTRAGRQNLVTQRSIELFMAPMSLARTSS
jgi:hypothetical protein